MHTFLVLIILASIGAYGFAKLESHYPNPVLLRCSACGSKLHVHLTGGWRFFELLSWQIVSWSIVWRLKPPIGIGIILVFTLFIPWGMAVDRLKETYWMWKHPLRCQGGGHYQPAQGAI